MAREKGYGPDDPTDVQMEEVEDPPLSVENAYRLLYGIQMLQTEEPGE